MLLKYLKPRLKLTIPFSLVIALVMVMVFYQILIQYWQPLAQYFVFENWKDTGLYFGALFSLILVGQSLAGHVCEKAETVNDAVSKALWLNTAALSLLVLSLNGFDYLISLALISVFSACRLLNTILHSIFHEAAPKDIRATLDSTVSMIVRLSLLLFMPLFGFVTSIFSWNTLLLFYLVTFILVVIIIKRRNSCEFKAKEAS